MFLCTVYTDCIIKSKYELHSLMHVTGGLHIAQLKMEKLDKNHSFTKTSLFIFQLVTDTLQKEKALHCWEHVT